MKKTIPLLFIALTGCNFGSSIADQKPTGSGGVAETGGTTGMASGGETGTLPAGTGGAASGGATEQGSGGATAVGMGGALGTGGRLNGTGGAGLGTEATGGAVRGRDGGQPPTGTGGAQSSGGAPGTGGRLSGTGGAPGTGGATGAGGSAAACVPAATPGPKGMDTGQACLNCHVTGGQMSRRIFTAAGTLYDSATGSKVVSGATVTITGSDNKKITIVTGSDGNFYTNSAIAFPASVQVSKCPDTVAMSATITNGNCNSCHGSTMRIHLP